MLVISASPAPFRTPTILPANASTADMSSSWAIISLSLLPLADAPVPPAGASAARTWLRWRPPPLRGGRFRCAGRLGAMLGDDLPVRPFGVRELPHLRLHPGLEAHPGHGPIHRASPPPSYRRQDTPPRRGAPS